MSRIWLAGLAACLLLSVWLRPAAAADALTVAVVPQFTPLQIHKDWVPFLERVADVSGVPLKLRVYGSIPEFEADLLAGGPDFAFMNPYHAVMAMRAVGYRPLVRDSRRLAGVLVVRREGSARSLRDLDGGRLAFPAPNAVAASLYMRALLAKEGIRFEPAYVRTHSNVFRQVILGEAVAGGAANSTLDREPEAVREQLRVLFETPAMAPHPFSGHPRVPPRLREAVAAAILRLGEEIEGRRLLDSVQMPAPVRADYDRDYLPLERLDLERHAVIGSGG